jgi:hypothetical protein
MNIIRGFAADIVSNDKIKIIIAADQSYLKKSFRE